MKPLYVKIGKYLLCAYLLSGPIFNTWHHIYNAWDGSRRSSSERYDETLQEKWLEYSFSHIDRLDSYRILIPASAFFGSPGKPVK